jgi:hypothetical protein
MDPHDINCFRNLLSDRVISRESSLHSVSDLPEERIVLEGGWGSSMLGIGLTGLSLVIMTVINVYPQSSVENFVLVLITAVCVLSTGAIVLTLVSDYPLILSTVSIFLLLLFWRLRNLNSRWLLALSLLTFLLALLAHTKTSDRRGKGRARKASGEALETS